MHVRKPCDSSRPLSLSRLPGALAVAALASLAPMMSGCEVAILLALSEKDNAQVETEYGYDEGYDEGGYEDYDYTYLETDNAKVQGSLGEAIGFGGDASYADVYVGGGYASIQVWADGTSATPWAMMTAIDVSGDDAEAIFKPGTTFHSSSSSYDQAPYVYVWGCSGTGADADALDYEVDGNEVDIEVTETADPGVVHLSFVVTYPDSQVVTGELDVTVPQ